MNNKNIPIWLPSALFFLAGFLFLVVVDNVALGTCFIVLGIANGARYIKQQKDRGGK